jgi:hypothetical protein
MTRVGQLAIAFAAARGGFGAGLIASPPRVAGGWLGDEAGKPAAQVAIRALGARDLALAGGTVAAALGRGPLLPWLLAAVACDLSDVAGTLAARDALPERAVPGTLALGGGSALAGAALAMAAAR